MLRRLARTLVAALAALGLLLVVVTVTPLCEWWAKKLAGPWNDPRGDTLIVLAGGMFDDGVPDADTYLRALYAIRAWREGGFQRVVLSGGKTGAPVSLAEAMSAVLASGGVPASVIWLETGSLNTRENALFTAKVLQSVPGTRVLMTSDYHMFRAHRAFTRAGMSVLPRPIPDVLKRSGNWRLRWNAFLDLLSESAKIGYYWARGWI